MKERPILFSAPMVRAILDGSKTQTRRVVKPQPHQSEYEPDHFSWMEKTKKREVSKGWRPDGNGGRIPTETVTPKGTLRSVSVSRGWFSEHCPYGQPGDRLWVRETFCPDWADHGPIYKANGGSAIEAGYPREPRWKPSIHMPRKFSRITLEITGVRVERLQEISEDDACAEGVSYTGPYPNAVLSGFLPRPDDLARKEFKLLWESINGADSWAANPWVWVIKFKRVA